MDRVEYICMECDNECELSLRGDSTDVPEECPIDCNDGKWPKWEKV